MSSGGFGEMQWAFPSHLSRWVESILIDRSCSACICQSHRLIEERLGFLSLLPLSTITLGDVKVNSQDFRL
jgi:hypothetical protein